MPPLLNVHFFVHMFKMVTDEFGHCVNLESSGRFLQQRTLIGIVDGEPFPSVRGSAIELIRQSIDEGGQVAGWGTEDLHLKKLGSGNRTVLTYRDILAYNTTESEKEPL